MSEEVGFEVESSRTFKTYFGAFITLIIVVISIIIALMIGNEIYERKTPSVSSSSNYLSNSNFTLKDYPLFFLVSDTNGKFVEDYTKYLHFDYFKVNRTNSVSDYSDTRKDQVALKCTFDHFRPFIGKIDNDTLNTYAEMPTYCVNWDDEDLIKNEYAYANSSYINFNFGKCDVTDINQKCADDLEDMIKEIYVRVYYMNSYLDSLDYNNPIKYYIDVVNQQISSSFLKRNFIRFVNDELESDNGWLLENKKKYNYISLNSIRLEINSLTPNFPLHMYWLTIVSPQIKNYSLRKYMKVQDLFADIGGIINALVIMSKLIFFNYLKYVYKVHIAEYLFNAMNDIHKEAFSQKVSKNLIINDFKMKENKENINDDYKNILNSSIKKRDDSHNIENYIKENDNKLKQYEHSEIKESRSSENKINFLNLNNLISFSNNSNKNINIKAEDNKLIIHNKDNDINENVLISEVSKFDNIVNSHNDVIYSKNKLTNIPKSFSIYKQIKDNTIVENPNKKIKESVFNIYFDNITRNELYENIHRINYFYYLLSMTCLMSKNKIFIRKLFTYVSEKVDFLRNIKINE